MENPITKFNVTLENVEQLMDNRKFYEYTYDYYFHSGDMPYGVAKARTGDPDQWMFDQLCKELGQ